MVRRSVNTSAEGSSLALSTAANSERAVRATALQSEIDEDGIAVRLRRDLGSFGGHVSSLMQVKNEK